MSIAVLSSTDCWVGFRSSCASTPALLLTGRTHWGTMCGFGLHLGMILLDCSFSSKGETCSAGDSKGEFDGVTCTAGVDSKGDDPKRALKICLGSLDVVSI